MSEGQIGAAWAAIAEAAPERAKGALPQMERVFYAGAAATYAALLEATPGAAGPQDVAAALAQLLARMDSVGDELRQMRGAGR